MLRAVVQQQLGRDPPLDSMDTCVQLNCAVCIIMIIFNTSGNGRYMKTLDFGGIYNIPYDNIFICNNHIFT